MSTGKQLQVVVPWTLKTNLKITDISNIFNFSPKRFLQKHVFFGALSADFDKKRKYQVIYTKILHYFHIQNRPACKSPFSDSKGDHHVAYSICSLIFMSQHLFVRKPKMDMTINKIRSWKTKRYISLSVLCTFICLWDSLFSRRS